MSEEEIINKLEEYIDIYEKFNSQIQPSEVKAIQGLLDLYNKEKEKNKRLEKFIENGEYTWKQKYNETFEYFKEELEKEKEKNKKIEETVKNGMKNLWVDTCAEDAGKYSDYMSIKRILEE